MVSVGDLDFGRLLDDPCKPKHALHLSKAPDSCSVVMQTCQLAIRGDDSQVVIELPESRCVLTLTGIVTVIGSDTLGMCPKQYLLVNEPDLR